MYAVASITGALRKRQFLEEKTILSAGVSTKSEPAKYQRVLIIVSTEHTPLRIIPMVKQTT